MKETGIRKMPVNVIKSFFITFSVMNIGNIRTTDILSVCIFAVCLLLLGRKTEEKTAGDRKYTGILSLIFVILIMAADYAALSDGLNNRLFVLTYLAATALGLFFLFGELLYALTGYLRKISFFEASEYPGKFPWKQFWIFAGILFLSMIPFFLMNYPAVMTPDSLSQYRQIIGTEGLSNHHPLLHTLLFGLFYRIGYGISGNTYVGIACYTLFQMGMIALCESYSIAVMRQLGLKKKYCISLQVLFLIYPFHLLYAVTIWKDVLFSMAVLVVTVTLFSMYVSQKENPGQPFGIRDLVIYTISSFGMCMLRHNGLYAFILTVVFVLYLFRKQIKKLLPISIAVAAACLIIRGPIMDVAGVKPGEFAYNLCIPLQQIARVITDGGTLTEEESTMLSNINELSYIPQNYQKGGADPMFAWVLYGNQEYLTEHKGEFLKLWISIGLRYPGEYVQAYIDQTKGYWYPMDPEQVVYFGITENEDGLVSQPVIKGSAAVKVNELLTKLYTMLPIYGIFYSMGAMFFGLLICFMLCLQNHKKTLMVCFLPVFTLMLTVFIAVPLVADMRYGYPLVLAMPFIAAMTGYGNHHLER